MTKLRITPDGRIRGLWDDSGPLGELGVVLVERASHMELWPQPRTAGRATYFPG